MELILIRRGNEQNLSKGLFEYLEALLHGRLSKVKEYVDLDDNSERQVLDMKTLDQTMAEYYQNKGIAIGKEKGIAIGKEKGIEIGTIKILCSLIADGILSFADAVLRSGLSKEEFTQAINELKEENK